MKRETPTDSEIMNYFSESEAKGNYPYLRFHSERYAFLLYIVNQYIEKFGERGNLRLLDIGPSYQTALFANLFREITIDTLGISKGPEIAEARKHISFDLNDCQYQENLPTVTKYDIIVMAEVLEHLYTAPGIVLPCIKEALNPGGYLIIQTPNAVALENRVKLLFGHNPQEMIRTSRTNPGHFREYTITELTDIGKQVGFDVDKYYFKDYFNSPSFLPEAIKRSLRISPKLRTGITIIYKR